MGGVSRPLVRPSDGVALGLGRALAGSLSEPRENAELGGIRADAGLPLRHPIGAFFLPRDTPCNMARSIQRTEYTWHDTCRRFDSAAPTGAKL